MLNNVVLIGRLTRDIELRYTQSGKAVTSFTLAVDRQFKGQDGEKQTDFIDCTVWEKQAETCAKYLSKGSVAAVQGSLQIRSYVDKEGNKRKAAEILVRNVRFLSPKKDTEQASPPPPEEDPFGVPVTFDESDIPF